MEAALQQFAHDVTGKVVLDAGLSTGGFTDCLLQNGASRIYGVDVGYGQVRHSLLSLVLPNMMYIFWNSQSFVEADSIVASGYQHFNQEDINNQ
jgi:hypothetical protein